MRRDGNASARAAVGKPSRCEAKFDVEVDADAAEPTKAAAAAALVRVGELSRKEVGSC